MPITAAVGEFLWSPVDVGALVVLGARHGFEVLGVDAVPTTAEMVNLHAIGDRADELVVGPAVRECVPDSINYAVAPSVSGGRDVAIPNPAITFGVPPDPLDCSPRHGRSVARELT